MKKERVRADVWLDNDGVVTFYAEDMLEAVERFTEEYYLIHRAVKLTVEEVEERKVIHGKQSSPGSRYPDYVATVRD